MNTPNIKKNRGFTLVETLVAIAILVTAVTAAFTAAQNGLSSAEFSKNQVTAFYLAQEGIEYIRNLRDDNGINDRDWLYNIAETGNPCELGHKCVVDAVNGSSGTMSQCSSACPPLMINSNGFYNQLTGSTTPFTREVLIESVGGSADEVAVTVTIKWSKGVVPVTFVARENLFNWQ